MTYVSLYRKYRPQTFDEVVGQDHITQTLARAVEEGRQHHAYLLTGPRGTGKTSTARILAKSLNCQAGPTANPDNTCFQCRGITDGSSVDVIEIDAASHGGVDDVRELRERVTFAPAAARTKVYIVDECHMLSTAGWNAFLKTVEEPPGHVVFVFATTEPHKVPATILSRTQRFDFRRVPANLLGGHCRELGRREGFTFDAGTLDLIVRAGDGSVRDTLSVLDQVVASTGAHVTLAGVTEVLGAVPEELLIETADAIADGDVAHLCRLVGSLADQGIDLRQFARDAVEHLRALFLLAVDPDAGLVETTPERLTRLSAQAGRLRQVELLRAVELLAEAQVQMRRGNTRLPLEVALVKAALPEASGDLAALSARLDRLERRTGVDPAAGTQPPAVAPSPVAHQTAPAPAVAPVPDQAAAGAIPLAPPTEPPAAPEAPPLDLDRIRAAWPAVLEAVKARKRRMLHAQLLEGSTTALEGGVLTLTFQPGHSALAEEVARDRWAPMFSEVFVELFGVALRLSPVVAAGSAQPVVVTDDLTLVQQAADVADAEAAEAAGDLPDDDEAHERALAALRSNLGATLLGE